VYKDQIDNNRTHDMNGLEDSSVIVKT